ncbi:uncharacterized protein DEA37_0011418 [Paragonimus westermani]|uniref:Uncharacterized protein n=1 Tax=Paragonimus westermani TaxID=34504 RepID=A0A5J4P205_9TREM|nr:uncharacterized protein DEA37_0011418 [Paragonimus westermani]
MIRTRSRAVPAHTPPALRPAGCVTDAFRQGLSACAALSVRPILWGNGLFGRPCCPRSARYGFVDEPRRQSEERQIIVSMEKRREVTREEYRLAEVMLSLTKAIKLRTQAEAEGRLLMTELDRRRGEMNLVKSTSPNRRAYVFSLSPRRQAAYRPRIGTIDSSVRQTSDSPHKSRILSTTRLQSGARQRKARGRSARVDQSQSDSDQSVQSTQLRGTQKFSVPRKTNRPNVSFATPDDLQPRTPSAYSQAATDQ